MSVFDHPAIRRAERDGIPTDNHLGLVETIAVVEDVHGKPLEITLDHEGVEFRLGREVGMFDAETALRIVSATLVAAHAAKDRQLACVHRDVDVKEVMRGDITVRRVAVCEDCGEQLGEVTS